MQGAVDQFSRPVARGISRHSPARSRRWLIGAALGSLVLTVAPLVAVSDSASATTVAGDWVEPLSASSSVVTTWQESGCTSSDPYYSAGRSIYSTGVDLASTTGAPVRSIGVGVVVANQVDTAWGTTSGATNSGLLVRYTADDGTPFTALYGDVQVAPGITVGDSVNAGQQIASVGSSPFLHLAIHPGGTVPGGDWTAGQCPVGSNDDGFVDPEAFLATHSPTAGTIADGTFVSHGGDAYRIAGGAPLVVSSWSSFGGTQPTTALTDAQWSALAAVPANGTFIQGAQRREIYRIAGGAPIYVSAWDTFGGSRPTVVVDDAVLDHAGENGTWFHLRAVPSNGTLVRSASTGTLFTIYSGHVTPTEAQGAAVTIDPAAIANAGTGGVWNHLLMVPTWPSTSAPVVTPLPTSTATPSPAAGVGAAPANPPAVVSRPRPALPPAIHLDIRWHGHAVGHGWLCLAKTRNAVVRHHTTNVGGCVAVAHHGTTVITPRVKGRYYLILIGQYRHVSPQRYAFTGASARSSRWTL